MLGCGDTGLGRLTAALAIPRVSYIFLQVSLWEKNHNQHLLLLSSSSDQNNPTPTNGHKNVPELLVTTQSRSSPFPSLPLRNDPTSGNAARQRTQPRIGTCVTETVFGERRKQATEDKGVAWPERRGDSVPARAGTSQPVPRVLSPTTAVTDMQGVGQGGRRIIEL